MSLLPLWVASLKLLIPKNFILFMGAVWLAVIRTYRIWLGTWWWLIAVLLGSVLYYGYHIGDINFIGLSQYIITILLISLAYVSARPSLGIKTYRYFFEHAIHIVWITLLFIVADQSFVWLIIAQKGYFVNLIWLLLSLFLTMNATFAALFIADSSGSLKDMLLSLVRSIRMILFSLPLLIIFVLSSRLFLFFLYFLIYHLFIKNFVINFALFNFIIFVAMIILLVPIQAAFLQPYILNGFMIIRHFI